MLTQISQNDVCNDSAVVWVIFVPGTPDPVHCVPEARL